MAMCVNDLIVQGAEPLFFLDYFATGKLNIVDEKQIITGIVNGCHNAGCALVGGETAEMPNMYFDGNYDLAGFSVGAVERDRLIDGSTIIPSDIILGLASSGIHSNGYSLVRKVVEISGLSYSDIAPFNMDKTLGDALLIPTRIYVKSCLAAIKSRKIKALAHITGGGLIKNIPRVLPTNVIAKIDSTTWQLPPVFRWIKKQANVDNYEMAHIFNCGIGMVVIVSTTDVSDVVKILQNNGETVYTLGSIEARHKNESQSQVINTWTN